MHIIEFLFKNWKLPGKVPGTRGEKIFGVGGCDNLVLSS